MRGFIGEVVVALVLVAATHANAALLVHFVVDLLLRALALWFLCLCQQVVALI